MAPLEGFLNLNKPAGWTSHDCVAKVRKILQMKRVGHGGTLDPAATGVLPIALGRATRLLQYLPTTKAYQATIRFGVTTTTDDLEGDRLTEAPCPDLTQEHVRQHLNTFIGRIQQIPPKYSAIQINGQRLYDLARAGMDVDVPVRTVDVHSIQVLDWQFGDFPELEVAITCGPGTYIRAIARDWGAAIGVGATLAQLNRTESHGFPLAKSLTFEQLTQQRESQIFNPIPPQQALNLPIVHLTPELTKGWLNGRMTPWDTVPFSPVPDAVQVWNHNSEFIGIGHLQQPDETASSPRILKPKIVFN